MNAGISRMLKVIATTFLLVHFMSCFYYMIAKLQDFDDETWVIQMQILDRPLSS